MFVVSTAWLLGCVVSFILYLAVSIKVFCISTCGVACHVLINLLCLQGVWNIALVFMTNLPQWVITYGAQNEAAYHASAGVSLILDWLEWFCFDYRLREY